jgi:LmbE family N-acetylglucosaminyl deacetylase
MTPNRLAAIRRQEQQAAADMLGVTRVLYLDEPDGELQPTLELRKRVVAEIRRYQPDAIIAPDPTRYFYTDYINHADHRAAGIVAIDAIFPAARNRMYHPELLAEGLEPHTVKDIYLVGPEHPDRWIDITAVFDKKLTAIRCHTSQIKDDERMERRVRGRHQAIDEYGREVFREGYRILTIG